MTDCINFIVKNVVWRKQQAATLKAYAMYIDWICKPHSHMCNMLCHEVNGIAALYINSQIVNLSFYFHCISSFEL